MSIHQNSYPEEYVHGAQVFYYDGSSQGKELAEVLQRQLIERADPDNTRQVKANDSYYLLKKDICAHRDCRVRFFVQSSGGRKAVHAGVSGADRLGRPYGDIGVLKRDLT